MRTRLRLSAFAAVLSLAACSPGGPPPPPPNAIPAGQSIGSGSISGHVTFKGQIPPREEINMSSDAVCRLRGGGVTREDVVVGAGGELRNVFVRVVSGLGDRVFAPPATHVVLDQRGCTYIPHVLGVQVNQLLEILNSDPTLHNIHSVPSANTPFNVGMPAQGMRIEKFFSVPEAMVKVKCDLHNWMIAWVGVTENPFFDVSTEQGTFRLKGLPAGEYTVEAWHELFGVRKATVKLEDSEAREIAFEFQP